MADVFPSSALPGDDDRRAWSSLWSRTTRGSIDLDGDDPLGRALRAHWAGEWRWMAGLRQLVDVGSGPAVLARHVLRGQPSGGSLPTWWCLDAAELPPLDGVPAGVRGLGATDFAAAAPPDGPCDALVSNFGLEYVPRPAVAAACARWLVPGGRLSAVVHAQGSVVDQTAARTLTDLSEALTGVQLFDRADALLQAIETLPADPAARQRHGVTVRAAYNEAVDALKARMSARGEGGVWIDMLGTLTQLIREALAGSAADSRARCQALKAAYVAEAARLRMMRTSAMGPDEQAAMASEFRAAGFQPLVWAELRTSAGQLAWHVSARRELAADSAPV